MNGQTVCGRPRGRPWLRIVGIALLAAYFASPFAIAAYAYWLNPPIVIGIVAAPDVSDADLAVIEETLDGFEEGFEGRVMAFRLNDTAFESENGDWLCNSYLYARLPADLADENGLDIVFIVANKPLVKNFDHHTRIWGIASTLYSRAAMTVVTGTSDDGLHERILATTAVHELLHIMGYIHPRGEPPCVMNSGHIGVELCDGQSWELPFRQTFWRLGAGVAFPIAMFELGLVMTFSMAPAFALAMFSWGRALKRATGFEPSFEFRVYSYGALYFAAVLGAYLHTTPNERVAMLAGTALACIGATAVPWLLSRRK